MTKKEELLLEESVKELKKENQEIKELLKTLSESVAFNNSPLVVLTLFNRLYGAPGVSLTTAGSPICIGVINAV